MKTKCYRSASAARARAADNKRRARADRILRVIRRPRRLLESGDPRPDIIAAAIILLCTLCIIWLATGGLK